MRILSAIHPPDAIRKILDCLGLPSRPPPICGFLFLADLRAAETAPNRDSLIFDEVDRDSTKGSSRNRPERPGSGDGEGVDHPGDPG